MTMAAKAKKATKAKARTKQAAVTVPNSPFTPGTKVGFHRPQSVEVERRADREPFRSPVKTATVKSNGTLEVSGLDKGSWCAAAPVGGTYRYVVFSVG
jgi:hypothetical protein